MAVKEWITSTVEQTRSDGVTAGVYQFCKGIGYAINSRTPLRSPHNIYDSDWDVAIILDAARPDYLEQLSYEYAFLPKDISSTWSVGSHSRGWMENTFWREETGETGYVSANPHTDEYADEDEFYFIDEVWRDGWDDDLNTVPAEAITNRTIGAHRETDAQRLLVHYMQPHFPSVSSPFGDGWGLPASHELNGDGKTVWDLLEEGELSLEEVITAYIKNFRYVLDEVAILLENVDAETVIITADHGQAFGEWGDYGHPGVANPYLHRVPWVTISASDTKRRNGSEFSASSKNVDADVESRLEDLGYK